MSDVTGTVAERIATAESELAQFRANRAQTQIAYEDALARDGDTASHVQALAHHDFAIATLESLLRGLQRDLVPERRKTLRENRARAYEARSRAESVYLDVRDEYPARAARLEAELTALRDQMAQVREDYGAAALAYGKAEHEERVFEDLHPESAARA